MAATIFTSPHPGAVFRVLRQAYREYLASGNAAHITVTTPPGQAASAPITVAGTFENDWKGVGAHGMPPSVTVALTQAGRTKPPQTALVNPATGAFTTTFPGATLVAGTATATVSTGPPYSTSLVTTPAFTLT